MTISPISASSSRLGLGECWANVCLCAAGHVIKSFAAFSNNPSENTPFGKSDPLWLEEAQPAK